MEIAAIETISTSLTACFDLEKVDVPGTNLNKQKIWRITYIFFRISNLYAITSIVLLSSCALLTLNFFHQVIVNPSQLLSIVVGSSPKTPSQTWNYYKEDFISNETRHISASFLASLAQAESGGDAFSTPPWVFSWTVKITQLYRPQSTAVGLYQFTSGTSDLASRFCIHEKKVVLRRDWYVPSGCWFNLWYFRTSGSDSIEMTAAYLTVDIDRVLGGLKVGESKVIQLASVIHLCGAGRGARFVKNGFRIKKNEMCGSHALKPYVEKIERLRRVFVQISNG